MIKWFKKWRRRRMTKAAIKRGLKDQHEMVADLLADIKENEKAIKADGWLAWFFIKRCQRFLENYEKVIESSLGEEWKNNRQ